MNTLPPELTCVTKTSKTLAYVLIIALPIIGFILGWQYGLATAPPHSSVVITPPATTPSPNEPAATTTPDTASPTPPPNDPEPPMQTEPGGDQDTMPYPGPTDDPATPNFPPHQTSDTCGITNCHGLEVTCGETPPEGLMCTMEYRLGDFCRQYVTCGVVDNSCQPIKEARYEMCVSCVQACLDEEDPLSSFECEDRCRAME
jgi:hypothetical protein